MRGRSIEKERGPKAFRVQKGSEYQTIQNTPCTTASIRMFNHKPYTTDIKRRKNND